MKYTKKDIPGKVFTFNNSKYKCHEVKGNSVRMSYLNDKSYFSNTVTTTLSYFNDGTWQVIDEPLNYEIY